jgi:basic membrane lipoprotein Med (substrate-binding protein (PBP1-ABC) superfamily)
VTMKILIVVTVLAATFLLITSTISNMDKIAVTDDYHATDAAFQDGTYLGKLAARQAQPANVATSRWATAADRKSFADGYTAAYDEALAHMFQQKTSDLSNVAAAAYGDGLYFGNRDAEQHQPANVTSVRWAQSQNEESFVLGYRQAYAKATNSWFAKAKGTSQAWMNR